MIVTPDGQAPGPSREQRAAFLVNTWNEVFRAALTGVAARNLMPDEVVSQSVKIANAGFNALMKNSTQFFSAAMPEEEKH